MLISQNLIDLAQAEAKSHKDYEQDNECVSIAHSVLVNLHTRPDFLSHDEHTRKSILVASIRNAIRDYYRRRKRIRDRSENVDFDKLPESHRIEVHGFIATLPKGLQPLAEMKLIKNLSNRAIKEQLKWTDDRLKVMLRALLRLLRSR